MVDTCVPALQSCHGVQDTALVPLEKWPLVQAMQVRSEVAVGSASTRSPATQIVQSVQEARLMAAENFPFSHGAQTRSAELVPAVN
jgi:hypothetical protein